MERSEEGDRVHTTADAEEDLSQLKDEVVSRLQAKDEQRQTEAAKKRAERQELKDPKESFAHFSGVFKSLIEGVKSKLTQQSPDFDDIASDIRSMQKLISDATIFLVPHDVRTSQQTVKDLENEIARVREQLQPKKKFSFTKKKDTTPSSAKAESSTKLEPVQTEPITKAEKPKSTVMDFDPEHSIIDKSALKLTVSLSIIENHDVVLQRLVDCDLLLPGRMTALRLVGLTNCKVYCGPVFGSVYVEKCNNCEIRIASQQIRIHDSENTDFYVFVKSNPIIEFCKNVRFAPYKLHYEGVEVDFEKCGFEPSQNKWNLVNDFRWLHPTQSPNWSVLSEDERVSPTEIPTTLANPQ